MSIVNVVNAFALIGGTFTGALLRSIVSRIAKLVFKDDLSDKEDDDATHLLRWYFVPICALLGLLATWQLIQLT